MRRRPPRSTRTDTLFPYTTLFRSLSAVRAGSAWHLPKPGSCPQHYRRPRRRPASVRVPASQLRPQSPPRPRSEEHTSELQSLMRISYAVFCLKKKKIASTNKLITAERQSVTHQQDRETETSH